MRRHIFISVAVLFSLMQIQAAKPLQLKNQNLILSFNPDNGALLEILATEKIRIALKTGPQQQVQAKNGEWNDSPAKLKSWKTGETSKGKTLTLLLQLPGWDIESVYQLFGNESMFSHSSIWKRTANDSFSTKQFRYRLNGLVIGNPEKCILEYPSHWPPRTRRLTSEPQPPRGDSDHMRGAILYNEEKRLGLSFTMQTFRSDFRIASRNNGNTVDFWSEYNGRAVMKPGDSLQTGETLISIKQGSKRELAASLGEAWLKNGFTVLARPNWTDGAVLYSAFPQGSVNSRGAEIGGLEPFRKYILPRLSVLGINICWLNPFNEGGYAVHSYYQFQKGVGVEQDLVNLARDAHSRKINILMDLIPHGPKPGKPYAEKILKEHPEWISRKSDGSPKLWWGGYAMDYASPGWQKAMADLASYYINKADIDGWRVDCARYSPDNECPTDGRIPSQSGTEGALKLMKTVHESINAHKPETILLGECHTLTHLSSMEFIYDSALGYNVIPSLQGQLPEEWVPKLKQYMDRNTSAIPQEMFRGLMHFSENHDMLKSLYRLGAGHTRALFSLNFLIPGIPLVNYDQDNGFGLHLKKLAALRKRPEFINGEALYKQTETDAPTVFTFTRQLPEQFSAVAINFSGTEKDVTMTCPEKSIKAVKKKQSNWQRTLRQRPVSHSREQIIIQDSSLWDTCIRILTGI